MSLLQRLTLEASPKAFYPIERKTTEQALETVFRQWSNLADHADEVALLWWFGAGEEILEFSGDMAQPVEWAKWLGFAEQHFTILKACDPMGEALHGFDWMYRPDAGQLTLGDMRVFAEAAKAASRKVLGCEVKLGIPFDPGNEFCKSDFRDRRHPELLLSDKGALRCVDATARMAADKGQSYAGFPEGIPEGLPFGTFFGRQCAAFFAAMPFDFLWLSNSFGFGRSPYAGDAVSEFFDGKTFHLEKNHEVREAVVDFWRHFRAECPEIRVACRGTDYSAGINMINQATPYEHIYREAGWITPPPNTPWQAVTGNHGVSLAGVMTQLAAYPGHEFPYRCYMSDPWWLNSPWEDRYQMNPSDMYLTMGLSRLHENGQLDCVTDVNLVSLDTVWGELPERFPDTLIPHLKRALNERPSAAGPFVWVYPFEEFREALFDRKRDADAVLAGDANIIQALNRGLPLSTIVTPAGLQTALAEDAKALTGRVVISPVPEADTAWEQSLLDYVQSGGVVLCYGSAHRASDRFLQTIGLDLTGESIEGLKVSWLSEPQTDTFSEQGFARDLARPSIVTQGGLREVDGAADYESLAVATDVHGRQRTLAGLRRTGFGGAIGWVRGFSAFNEWGRGLAAVPDTEAFPCAVLFRLVLDRLGWSFRYDRARVDSGSPKRFFGEGAEENDPGGEREMPDPHNFYSQFTISRNGFVLTANSNDPDMTLKTRTPFGAPVLPYRHTRLMDGHSCFRFSEQPFLHGECRVFVEQEAGTLLYQNIPTAHPRFRLRRMLYGLHNATVRYFPKDGCFANTRVLVNPNSHFTLGEERETAWQEHCGCRCLVFRNVTGRISIGWSQDDAIMPHPVRDLRVDE